jgi:hypothetical protein
MFIRLAESGFELLDPHNFKELKLVRPSGASFNQAAKDRLGRIDGDHIWVKQAWFLAQEPAADGEWRLSFEAMKTYANSKGWVDDVGAIRVHVEDEK